MSPDNSLHYFLLLLLSLWLLSSFCSPALDNLFSISLAMAKSSGLSAMDVLCSFSSFLITHYLFKRLHRGDQVTTSISWSTQRASLSFNLLSNAVQVSLNLQDLATRLTVYCRDSIILLPGEKSTASSTMELARAVLYALMLRGSLPFMMGTFMATDIIQRWMCDLAGLVAMIITLAPSLVLPSTPNVVSAIHLQEPAEASLHEERTLIQTPSPNQKKKWIILVNRLPTPTRDRSPSRRPLLPSSRTPPVCSPNNLGDHTKAVVLPVPSNNPGSVNGVGVHSRVTGDNAIEHTLSHPGASTPVADRINPSLILKDIDFFANSPHLRSSDRSESKSSSILEMTVPEVIVEPASSEFFKTNDTFSLIDILSGESEISLVGEQDMGMILADVSGDDEFGSVFSMPEELETSACVSHRFLGISQMSEKPERSLGPVSALSVPAKSEVSTLEDPKIIAEKLTAQDNPAVITEDVPLIIITTSNESYGANDTFSLTDLLASTGAKDNLLDVQEMRNDLQSVSIPEIHTPTPSSEKATVAKVCADEVPASVEGRGVLVAGPSTHLDSLTIDKPSSSSKKCGHKRYRGLEDIITKDIYTPYGPFPVAKMPYELFSPASMRASEVASALLTDKGRIRCADWRVGVERGQQLLHVEQLVEQNAKDLAECEKMQAALKGIMREHGLEVPATPPRVPDVQVTQASPDSDPNKLVLDPTEILLKAHHFPPFLEKAVPLKINTSVGFVPSSSLAVSESVDSMYDPDFPGLNGKQADRYPKLNSDWPADFPTEADTSDEWKLTQEMIDFWAARKAKMEAEKPLPPVNIDDLSMKVDDGDENDRTFADFEDSGEYNDEDEQCIPGNSRLKCVGWRCEVVPIIPQPPKEPRVHVVETVGNAILNQMHSIYSMYGEQDAEPAEESPGPASPSPPSPPRVVGPSLAPVAESESVSAFTPAPRAVAPKKVAAARQSTTQAALTTRVLRPRPAAPAKTTLPASLVPGSVSDPKVLSKLRPRASIATSTANALVEKKAVSRQSLPAPKATSRRSLAQLSAAGAPKASLTLPRTTRRSLALPEAVPKPSTHTAVPAPALRQTIAAQAASMAIVTLKTASQSQPKSKPFLPVSKVQPKTLAGVKRVPLAPIQTNVARNTTTNTASVQKSISKLPPLKRTSLAPPPVQVAPGDAPKSLPPRPSLSRLPARRTSTVLRR